nr:MAG: hypothetical protein 2 [Leviviridae sp.]
MALTDPQSVTISGTAVSLPRISVGENSARYRSADGSVDMEISHTYGRRETHRIRLHHNKVSADPMSPSLNRPFDESVTLVINRPDVGYSAAETKALADSLLAALSASSGALITKLLGGES